MGGANNEAPFHSIICHRPVFILTALITKRLHFHFDEETNES